MSNMNMDETYTVNAMTNEAENVTVDKTAVVDNKENEGSDWRKVVIGGVAGIVLGAGAAYGAERVSFDPEEGEGNTEGNTPEKDPAKIDFKGTAPLAHSVNDEMTFGEAFAAARAEVGPGGVFEWHGHLYGTYYATEWDNMTSGEKAAYRESVLGVRHTSSNTTKTKPEVIDTKNEGNEGNTVEDTKKEEEAKKDDGETNNEKKTEETGNTDNDKKTEETGNTGNDEKAEETGNTGEVSHTDEEVEVTLLGHQTITNSDGSVSEIGQITINGHNAVVVDVDVDGNYDILGVDIDGDGKITENEIAPLQPGTLTADDFDAHSVENATDNMYANLPDYVNDADPSSFA